MGASMENVANTMLKADMNGVDVQMLGDACNSGKLCGVLMMSKGRLEVAKDGNGLARAYELELLDMVNASRLQYGLSALVWDERIAKAALLHSQDMFKRKFYDHINPDKKGPSQRLQVQGVKWPAGENIYRGPGDAISAHYGWMNSSGHRANILTLGPGFIWGQEARITAIIPRTLPLQQRYDFFKPLRSKYKMHTFCFRTKNRPPSGMPVYSLNMTFYTDTATVCLQIHAKMKKEIYYFLR